MDTISEKELELKGVTIGILRKLISAIKKEDYSQAMLMFGVSPAGDGYGRENHYVDCSCILEENSDLYDVIEKLKEYKEAKKGPCKFPKYVGFVSSENPGSCLCRVGDPSGPKATYERPPETGSWSCDAAFKNGKLITTSHIGHRTGEELFEITREQFLKDNYSLRNPDKY